MLLLYLSQRFCYHSKHRTYGVTCEYSYCRTGAKPYPFCITEYSSAICPNKTLSLSIHQIYFNAPFSILHIIILLTANTFTYVLYQQYLSYQQLLFMVHTNVSFSCQHFSSHQRLQRSFSTETEYALGTRAEKWQNRTSDHRGRHMIKEDKHATTERGHTREGVIF